MTEFVMSDSTVEAVRAELAAFSVTADRLRAFIDRGGLLPMEPEERGLLVDQIRAMDLYVYALKRRIGYFEPPVEEEPEGVEELDEG